MAERPYSRITLIQNPDCNMAFTVWVNHIKLRFETLQWQSSLAANAFILHHDVGGMIDGIIIEVPFPIGDETFVRRMGARAMSTILRWEILRDEGNIESSFPNRIPDEMYWIFIKDQNIQYDQWLNQLQEYFNGNNWEHEINAVIRNNGGERVGVFIKMPFPMSFLRFDEQMFGRTDTIRYRTKTTRNMTAEELTYCFSAGFFDPI